jgi:RNA-directed DNA polymerase
LWREGRYQGERGTAQPVPNAEPGERPKSGWTVYVKQPRGDPEIRFTALLHHVSVDLLRNSYYNLKRGAAAGVDEVTWQEYGDGLEERL